MNYRMPQLLLLAIALFFITGCASGPALLPVGSRATIDRAIVEYPAGYELQPFINNLSAPSAIAFDEQGNVLIAEGAVADAGVRIFGFRPDGTRFDIYPTGQRVPLFRTGFTLYGPIGGLAVRHEKVYVSHRDARGRGVITAFNYDGTHSTVIADLPAQGDYSVTDLAFNPTNGRLYFGVGAATNAGIVGLDNWETGWVEQYTQFSDVPYFDYVVNGFRFNTRNPRGGLFGGDDIASTGPFQAFGVSTTVRVPKSPTQRPTAAIYSVNPAGGAHRVEAHGIRMPRGLAFNEFFNLYATNNGMELRGSRPVKDDPDALLRIFAGTWYGWPDYSTTLRPVTDPRFKPDSADLAKTSWPEITFLLDHEASMLIRPNPEALLRGTFNPLSGAAKLAFVPSSSPFAEFQGNAIVALSGDRAPFATNGRRLKGVLGRKVVRVDVDKKEVYDFVRNTSGQPASQMRNAGVALERPYDVKFGPDGAIYIVDLGRLEMKDGREVVRARTGKVFRLVPQATAEAEAQAAAEAAAAKFTADQAR